jgi:hypothetical protein
MSSWCINEVAAIGNEQGKKGMETPLYRNFWGMQNGPRMAHPKEGSWALEGVYFLTWPLLEGIYLLTWPLMELAWGIHCTTLWYWQKGVRETLAALSEVRRQRNRVAHGKCLKWDAEHLLTSVQSRTAISETKEWDTEHQKYNGLNVCVPHKIHLLKS